jgi:hypothetical protein
VLTAYLVCLLVGGVFVGLSVFAGLGKDTDTDKDFGKDFDKSFDKGFEKDFDKSFDKDLDPSFDNDFDGHVGDHGHGPAPVHDAPISDAALAGHPSETRRPRRRFRFPKGRLFLPFTSLRFWTFGACFFGLTGVALTQLGQVAEPTAMLTSLAIGLGSGTATAWLVRSLRQPVGAVGGARALVGQVGELVFALAPGQTSKVRLRVPGRPPREILAVLGDADTRALPRDTRVVVLDLRDGKAVVEAADPSMYPTYAATLSAPDQDAAAVQERPDEEEA